MDDLGDVGWRKKAPAWRHTIAVPLQVCALGGGDDNIVQYFCERCCNFSYCLFGLLRKISVTHISMFTALDYVSLLFFSLIMHNNEQWQSIQLCIDVCIAFLCVSRKRKGGSVQMRVRGYIRTPPDLEPMARIFCTGSKARAVGW